MTTRSSNAPERSERAAPAPRADNKARSERDRFVALAYAAADLLIELDRGGRVRFAGGACQVLLGCDEKALIGQPLADHIMAADREMFLRVLKRAHGGARIDHLTLHFIHRQRGSVPLVLRGYQLPDLGGHTFLALRLPPPLPAPDPATLARDRATGLLKPDALADAAAGAAATSLASGEEVKLTLVSLGALDEFRQRLDATSRETLSAALAATVRASSLGGDTAAQIDPDSYGLVHAADADLRQLHKDMLDAVRRADPTGSEIKLQPTTVALDVAGIEPQQTIKVLRYIMQRFCEQPGGMNIRSLNDGLSQFTAETVGRIERVTQTLKADNFTVVYQPICDLATRRPHHFEALVRFDPKAGGLNTFETITLAEEVGLILDLDMAICRRVLAEIKARNGAGYHYVIAANLSAQSLASPRFVEELRQLVASEPKSGKNLIFELTESAKVPDLNQLNEAIQGLRRAGHLICLDDLGAGEAAFRYLGQLDVDVAKIDGQFVRGAGTSTKGRALLKAMASVCRDLGVMTVGEMIEDENQALIVRECGLTYGQGYLFGKPASDISSFHAPRPAQFERKPQR